MRKSYSIIILMLTLLSSACSKKTPIEANGNSLSTQEGSYVFYVDRIAEHPNVQFPMDTLTEDQYSLIVNGKIYEVKFSADGEKVYINNDSLTGSLNTETGLKKSYSLIKGVFAGGRFVVWHKAQPANAELTIYGSGVPIIVSERGRLIKK
jgi:hypothetical protein